jgi:hypothetical protein
MSMLTQSCAGAIVLAAALTLPWPARAAATLVHFDTATVGTPPADCAAGLTGGGGPGSWVITADPTAPSGGRVLAQTSTDPTASRFPLCIYEPLTAADVEVAVQFKAVAGRVDQAAGLVARLQDQENYYITRANALENNVRLYKVVRGTRTQFAGADVPVASGTWHSLKLVVQGPQFQVFLNDTLLLTAKDTTITAAGKVGLWTKADSVTYFDDLSIVSHDTR